MFVKPILKLGFEMAENYMFGLYYGGGRGERDKALSGVGRKRTGFIFQRRAVTVKVEWNVPQSLKLVLTKCVKSGIYPKT